MTNAELAQYGLNQSIVAQQLGVKRPYVSMYISGRGYVPRVVWQKIHEFFLELKAKPSPIGRARKS